MSLGGELLPVLSSASVFLTFRSVSILGVIRIWARPPASEKKEHYNHKGWHSIIVHLVVDNKYVLAGWCL